MKINRITQTPFGTILSLSDNIPSGAIDGFLRDETGEPHKIKGTPSDIWTEVLLDWTTDFMVGQEVLFETDKNLVGNMKPH